MGEPTYEEVVALDDAVNAVLDAGMDDEEVLDRVKTRIEDWHDDNDDDDPTPLEER